MGGTGEYFREEGNFGDFYDKFVSQATISSHSYILAKLTACPEINQYDSET